MNAAATMALAIALAASCANLLGPAAAALDWQNNHWSESGMRTAPPHGGTSLALASTERHAHSDNIQDGALQASLDAVQREFEHAQTPSAYQQARAHALLVMKEGDQTKRPVIAFQAALIAADCTYFATAEDRQSQDREWAKAEMTDLNEAARRFTDAASRPWVERYVNLLAASAMHILQGVLPKIQPALKDLCRQLAADAERTIPEKFHYRARQDRTEDDVETERNLARLSWQYGSRNSARARLLNAIDEARRDGKIDLWLQLEEERYQAERSLNPPEVPLQQLREEARLGAQGLRESYSSRAGRIWVNALFDQAYGQMLQDQMSSSESATPAELFRSSETLKARTLLDAMSAPPSELAQANRPAAESLETEVLGFAKDTSDENDVQMQETKLISQLSPFGAVGDREGKRQASLARLEQMYQNAGAGFAEASKPASLERVQSALEPKEAILEYVIPFNEFYRDQHLYIFLITHTSFVIAHVKLDDVLPRNSMNSFSISVDGKAPVTFSPLGERVAALREEIRENEDKAARLDLKAFYRVLIEPLIGKGFKPKDYDRLIVVPHGPLHYLPFGALLDDEGKFLVQTTAISIVPSASIWLLLQGRSSGAIHSFVGFGNPTLNRPDLPSLSASESEVNRIADELNLPEADAKHVYIREQATEERFLREAPGANLLHISTHGEFPDENALDRHGVMLGKGQSDDGVVRASTVRKLNLSLNRLVVLSVCNGGLYRIGPADEPYGLLPAFLQAGSQNAVGTLWKVEEVYGRLLTTEFYKTVLNVGSAEALRQASVAFIRQGQTIRRWAGFASIGPGRPFSMSGGGKLDSVAPR